MAREEDIQDFKRRLESLESAIKSSSFMWWYQMPEGLPGDASSGNGMREAVDELWRWGREVEALRNLFDSIHGLAKTATMRAPADVSIGKQIRARRKELFPSPKVKTEDFSKSVGADKSTLLKWEADEQIPSDDNAKKLAELLRWPELPQMCEAARQSRDVSRDPISKKI